jgi:hypothetical protein
MTKMKALSMLDHVMLWMARIFLMLVIAFASLPFLGLALNLATELWMWFVFPDLRGTIFTVGAESVHRLGQHPLLILSLAYACLWYFAFRMLPSRTPRICLGLSAALFLVLFVYSEITVVLLRLNTLASHESFLVGMGLYSSIGIVGFASLLWVSVRPPNQLSHSVNSVCLP